MLLFVFCRLSTLLLFVLLSDSLLRAQASAAQDAQYHYRVAMVALDKNDFRTAGEEMKQAIDSAPDNSLLYFNLAVIQSKDNKAMAAKRNLEKAIKLGLPEGKSDEASTLRARLAYEVRGASDLSSYVGIWTGEAQRALLPLVKGDPAWCGFPEAYEGVVDATWKLTLSEDARHPDRLVGTLVLRGKVVIDDGQGDDRKKLCAVNLSRQFKASVEPSDGNIIQMHSKLLEVQGAQTRSDPVFLDDLEATLSTIDRDGFVLTTGRGDSTLHLQNGFGPPHSSMYPFVRGSR